MIAVDVSILAYAVNRFVPEHARAAELVERLANGDRPWAVAWPALHEFMQLATHPHMAVRPLRAADAWTFLEELMQSPSATLLLPTERHLRTMREVLEFLPPLRGLPPGLETAVVLREHGVRELLSSDRSMRQYRFLDVKDPVHGELWRPDTPGSRRYRRLTPPTSSRT